MKYCILFLFIFFRFHDKIFDTSSLSKEYSFWYGQPNIDIRDTLLFTPAGPTLKSNIHYIDNKHHLKFNNKNIQIINSQTGDISEFAINSSLKGINATNNSNTWDFKDGWTTYANCQIYVSTPEPVVYFSTDWTVPQPPLKKSGQLIYIFNGLNTIEDGVSYILQPVLQWGKSPAGGGDYWSVCNWFVTSNQFFYDSLIKVNPGTKLQGLIKLISTTDSIFTYTSSFVGLTSEFQVINSPRLFDPCEVLETFNLLDCDQYPSQEKVTMSNIKIKTGDFYPPVIWTSTNRVVGCGQLTNIIQDNSSSGIVDIYFHTPSSDNYFDVIQIYPNPVVDKLKIKSLKEISNLKIEVYSFYGILLQTVSNINVAFDYVYNRTFYHELDLQQLLPGIYFLRINYDNKEHTFKIIKN